MDTCDLTIFTDELDPKLEGVILPDAENKGGYVINGRVVLLKILETVDKGKQFLSRSYDIATKTVGLIDFGVLDHYLRSILSEDKHLDVFRHTLE